MNKDCDLNPMTTSDFCYQKSFALLQKIRKNKNFCLDKDDCDISFENLNPAAAQLDDLANLYTQDVYNEEITVYCNNSSDTNNSLFTGNTDLVDSSSDNYFTVQQGTFKTTIRLISPSEDNIAAALASAQNAINLIATNYAVMSLNCNIYNDEQSVSCTDYISDERITDYQLVDESSSTINAKDSTSTQILNASIFLPDDTSNISNYIEYIQGLTNVSDTTIQYKTLANKIAYEMAVINLNCEFQNQPATVQCASFMHPNFYYIYAISSGDYSSSTTVNANTFSEILQGSSLLNYDTLSDEEYFQNSLDNENLSKGNTYIQEFENFVRSNFQNKLGTYIDYSTIGQPPTEFPSNDTLLERLFNQTQQELIDNQECFYGNEAKDFYCGGSGVSVTDSTTGEVTTPSYNDGLVPTLVSNTVDVTNTLFIDSAQFISKALKSTITFSDGLQYNWFTNSQNAQDAFNETNNLANAYAALTLDSCGYYNHKMYIYCDRGLITDNLQNDQSEIYTGMINQGLININNTLYFVSSTNTFSLNTYYSVSFSSGNNDYITALSGTTTYSSDGEEYRISSSNNQLSFEKYQYTDTNGNKVYAPINLLGNEIVFMINNAIYSSINLEVNGTVNSYIKDLSSNTIERCNLEDGIFINPSSSVFLEKISDATSGTCNVYTVSNETAYTSGTAPYGDPISVNVIDSSGVTSQSFQYRKNSAIDYFLSYEFNSNNTNNKLCIINLDTFLSTYLNTLDLWLPSNSATSPIIEYFKYYSNGETYITSDPSIIKNVLNPDLSVDKFLDPNLIIIFYKNNYTNIDLKIYETNLNFINVKSGLRTVVDTSSVFSSYLNYGSVNSLNYSDTITSTEFESQLNIDRVAAEILSNQISCIYGNVERPSVGCSSESCANGNLVSQQTADAIQSDDFIADTPETADAIAEVIQLAKVVCICGDRVGTGGGGIAYTFYCEEITIQTCSGEVVVCGSNSSLEETNNP